MKKVGKKQKAQYKNNNEPLISVIVPIYNVEKYIGKCLESIINQTYRNLEIIIVDDGSTDGSNKICETYAQKDQRFRVIHQKNNGPSAARNAGIKIARGKYIGFVDSDDWIDSNMYKTLFQNITKHDADISVCGIKRVRSESNSIKIPRPEIIGYNQSEYIQKFFKIHSQNCEYYPCNKLYKKCLLDSTQYPIGLTSEDVLGTYKAILKAQKIVVDTQNYYYYRQINTSITGAFSEQDFDLITIWQKMVDYTQQNAPQYLNYAILNQKRITLTLLYRIAINQAGHNPKVPDLIKQLKQNKHTLLKSSMPPIRKILTFLFCLNYNLTSKIIYMLNKIKLSIRSIFSSHHYNAPTQKLTVAEVVGEFCGGGVETCLYNYIERLDRSKYRFVFITHGKPNPQVVQKFERLGCTFYQVPPKSQNFLKNIHELWRIYRHEKPDIVHCHISHSNYAPLFVALLCGVKTRISHSHDARSSKSLARKIEGKLVNAFATDLIACGKDAGKYVYGKRKFQILHNAIDGQRFAYDGQTRKSARKQLGVREDEFLIGNFGRLHQQKNQLFLIEIFHTFHQKHPNSRLLLVGEGPLRSNILDKAKDLGISESLILLNNQDNIQDYYQAIDLYLLPSTYEGLPFVLVEAQASNLPCVVSSVVTTEAAFNDSVTFVDLQDDTTIWAQAIEHFYKTPIKRHSCLSAAKKAGYDLTAQTEELDTIYQQAYAAEHQTDHFSTQAPSCIAPLIFSKSFMFFNLLIFLKPRCFWYHPKLNAFLNLLIALNSAIILAYYGYTILKTRYISTLQKAILTFFIAMAFSTFLGAKDFTTLAKTYGLWFVLSAYVELCIRYARTHFLSILNIFCASVILIHFITILVFPNGMHGSTADFPVYFLGYDNSTALTILLGAMYCFFYGYYTRKTSNLLISYFTISISALTFFITWSATGIIGSVMLLFFCLFFHAHNKYPRIFNLKNYFVVFGAIFIAIVFLHLQDCFAPIIQNFLHKDLTLTGRTAIWDKVLAQLAKHPLLGTGVYDFDTRVSTMRIYHAHCSILQILLEGGIIGLFTYLNIYRIIWKNLRKHLNHKTVNIFSFALCIFLVISITDVYKDSQLLYIFLVLSYYSRLICPDCKHMNHHSMKQILLVLGSKLPLPATKGGAVETLVMYYIDHNEETKKYHFTIYSAYDKDAAKLAKNYHSSTFHYLPINNLSFTISRYIRGAARKFLHLPVLRAYDAFLLNELLTTNNNYDLVITENDPETAFILSQQYNDRVILHLHNDTLHQSTPHGQLMLHSYRSIYAVSDYIRKRILTIDLGATSKTHLLMNGVKTDELTGKTRKDIRAKIRAKHGFATNDIVLLFNGRICADKGVYELIQAFNSVHKKIPRVKLLIVGSSAFSGAKSTSYVEEVQKLASQHQDSIIFTGYIPHEDINKILVAADIQVVPSICDDSCPLTVLEGMQAGLPQIVTRSGGIPEEVSTENAIIVERNNLVSNLEQAILQLVSDPQMRCKMAQASRERSQLFTEKQYVKNFYHLLQDDLKTIQY